MVTNIHSITTLHDLQVDNARRFVSAEAELKNILPGWINRAMLFQLKAVLQKYLDVVEQHIQKLETYLEEEQVMSVMRVNRVMEALIAETEEKAAVCTDAEVRDACLLSGVQSINHFKISMYGTAAAFATTLGNEKQAAIFHEAGVNEKQIDDRLSQLALYEVNRKASTPIVLPE